MLAEKAVRALSDGHDAAAQALAVVVAESAIAGSISGGYEAVKRQVLCDPDLVPFTRLRLNAALAAIGPFYTSWSPKSKRPPPPNLSRHVTVHQADTGHFTEANAVIAVMLLCSVLRAFEEMQQLVDRSIEDDNHQAS